jgi:hypothetical protein
MKMCRDNATPTRLNTGGLHFTGNIPIDWTEIRQFLPFKRDRAVEPDASKKELAEELGIDSEQKKHLKRLIRRIGNIRSWADVERKLKQLFIFHLIRNRGSYENDVRTTKQFFKFIQRLDKGVSLTEAAKRAGLIRSQTNPWLYKNNLPRLIRIAVTMPQDSPRKGQRWLPTKISSARRMSNFIEVPLRLKSVFNLDTLLSHILSEENDSCDSEYRLTAFLYVLGLIVSDSTFDTEGDLSTSVKLTLSCDYDWSESVGRAFVIFLRMFGIRVSQRRGSHTNSNMIEWRSNATPFFVWLKEILLGLSQNESKKDNPIDVEWLLHLPPSSRIAFIQGIADGDGYASLKKQWTGISSEHNQKIIQTILSSLGIESRVYDIEIRITKKKSLETAANLPLFKYSTGRQLQLEEIVKMLAQQQGRRKPIADSERDLIFSLHEKKFSAGEIAKILWIDHGISRRTNTIQNLLRREKNE